MCKILSITILIFLSQIISAQTEVDVTDLTLKVAGLGTEELYYGFAEGDKVIFNMTETNGKDLKEISITEYPNNVKYQNRSTSKVENKVLNIVRKGVYKFSFYNSNVKGRVINIIIKRIPISNDLVSFNTKVIWRNSIDTTYKAEQRQYLIASDTSFVDVINTVASVHSVMNENGNRTIVDFILPQDTKKWAFWIGVGQEAKKAYQKDVQTLANMGSQFAPILGMNPLAGLLLDALPTLTKTNNGENVKYYFITDYENALKFKAGQQFLQIKHGDVISDNCKMSIGNGYIGKKMFVGLSNDNTLRGIDVSVIITAMVVKNRYETRTEKVIYTTNIKKPFIEE